MKKGKNKRSEIKGVKNGVLFTFSYAVLLVYSENSPALLLTPPLWHRQYNCIFFCGWEKCDTQNNEYAEYCA